MGVPKTGKDQFFQENSRPISFLPTVSFTEDDTNYTEELDMLSIEQFKCREQPLTKHQVMGTVEYTYEGFQRNMVTDIIFRRCGTIRSKRCTKYPLPIAQKLGSYHTGRSFQVTVYMNLFDSRATEIGLP